MASCVKLCNMSTTNRFTIHHRTICTTWPARATGTTWRLVSKSATMPNKVIDLIKQKPLETTITITVTPSPPFHPTHTAHLYPNCVAATDVIRASCPPPTNPTTPPGASGICRSLARPVARAGPSEGSMNEAVGMGGGGKGESSGREEEEGCPGWGTPVCM